MLYEESHEKFGLMDKIQAARPVTIGLVVLVIALLIGIGVTIAIFLNKDKKTDIPKITNKAVNPIDPQPITLAKGVDTFQNVIASPEAQAYIKNFDTDCNKEGINNPYVNWNSSIDVKNMVDPRTGPQTISFKGGSIMTLTIPYKTDLTFDVPPKKYDSSTAFQGDPTIESPKYATSDWSDTEVMVLYQISPIPEDWTINEKKANEDIQNENDVYDNTSPKSLTKNYRYKSFKMTKWVIANFDTAQLNINLQELFFYTETSSYMGVFVLVADSKGILNQDLSVRHGIRFNVLPEMRYSVNIYRPIPTVPSLYVNSNMGYYMKDVSQVYNIDWDLIQAIDSSPTITGRATSRRDPLMRYIPLSSCKVCINLTSILSNRSYSMYISSKLDTPVHVVQITPAKNDVYNTISIQNYFMNDTSSLSLGPGSNIGSSYFTTLIVFPANEATTECLFITASNS